MCLLDRRAHRTPWNKSRIRYKWMKKDANGVLVTPYMKIRVGPEQKFILKSDAKKAKEGGYFLRLHNGIHVHVTLKSALKMSWAGCALYKVRCTGFLHSGGNEEELPGVKEETWDSVQFIIPRGKRRPVPIARMK